jgi:hypothetical protein
MQLARAPLFAALFPFSRFRRGIAAADRIAMKDLSRSTAALAFLCAGFPLVQPAAAQTAQTMPAWPDTFLARVEALALVETLNATLLAARSATFTLDKWCADHKLAGETKSHARLFAASTSPSRTSSAGGYSSIRTNGSSSAMSSWRAVTGFCPRPTTGMCRRGSPPK